MAQMMAEQMAVNETWWDKMMVATWDGWRVTKTADCWAETIAEARVGLWVD